MKTLAVWEGGPSGDLEYLLAGTPSSTAVTNGACVYERGVRQVFPNDPLLRRIGANAYVGMPLLDAAGRPVGIILLLYKRPLDDTAFATAMLAEVAPRAVAELGRKHAEDALRESEQRYRCGSSLEARMRCGGSSSSSLLPSTFRKTSRLTACTATDISPSATTL